MTKIIGLTGGIGSGKTTVAKFFERLGVPVYIADLEAKKIMDSPEVLDKIREEFGQIVFEGDVLDRKSLADVVFKNPDKLAKLNEIVHPLVKRHFEQWIELKKDCPFVIKEAAILFESGSYKDCDWIITVSAPVKARVERVVKRDLVVSESVMDRMNNQWTDEMREEKSDFVILNVHRDDTFKQVQTIYQKIKEIIIG